MKKYISLSIALIFCCTTLFAQSKRTKKADKHFDRLEYVKAAEQYNKLVDKGHADAYVYQRLGDSYYKLGDTKNAAIAYQKYLDKAGDQADAYYYYRYAQMEKSNGNNAKSNEAMQKFAQNSPNDKRAKAFRSNPNYLAELNARDVEYEVDKLDINSDAQDFGAFEHDSLLYFVSARNNSRKKYAWNGQPTLDVYVASQNNGKYTDPKLLKGGDVNTKYHEGAIVITKDNKTMYFTRNDYTNNKFGKDDDGIGQLKIYRAKNVNGKWTDVDELPFNSSEFSTGHVALSPDESVMYFASDRPGGYGESDIYKVNINNDGTFGEPENLGSTINTPGKDDFPFVDSEGTLYFSSEGHLGMGGLDVFKAKKQGDNFNQPENMGKDINSRADDFSFSYNPETERGFVSSNRSGKVSDDSNIANDNIYGVLKIKKQIIMIYVKVIDDETERPIKETALKVYQSNNEITSKKSNEDGFARFDLPGDDNHYAINASADGYEPKAVKVPYQEEGKINLVIRLVPKEKMITEEEIKLNPIHFDFDKSNIRKDAALELDKLVDIMKTHPDMKIHVVSHTDHWGSKTYNQQLSERRAQSTVKYVIDHGIDKNRINGEGKGKSEPKIKCGTDCTKDQNEINRRSEFKIVK